MISQPTDNGEIKQLKSHFLLVNFNFILAQFQIKRAHFSLVFPTYVQFCTQIVVPFLEPIQQPIFLAFLKKSACMPIGSQIAYTQVIIKQPSEKSTIE